MSSFWNAIDESWPPTTEISQKGNATARADGLLPVDGDPVSPLILSRGLEDKWASDEREVDHKEEEEQQSPTRRMNHSSQVNGWGVWTDLISCMKCDLIRLYGHMRILSSIAFHCIYI